MTNSTRGCTIWLTGLSGAGKSTIADQLVPMLKQRGSKEDRDINIRRIGFVCHLLTRNGVFAVAAAISPYQSVRDENRALINDFIEVYVKASLDECIKRDVKGLYKKALSGEIKTFTGVSDPYEPPVNPEVVCDTETETPFESALKIVSKLEQLGYLAADSKNGQEESPVLEKEKQAVQD